MTHAQMVRRATAALAGYEVAYRTRGTHDQWRGWWFIMPNGEEIGAYQTMDAALDDVFRFHLRAA